MTKHLLSFALVLGVSCSQGFAQAPSGTTWLDVDYRRIVDTRAITNSGEALGVVLDRIAAGRSSDSPDDYDAKLLHPHLEPYAFVLADALDATRKKVEPHWMEIGALWPPGSAQPAWVELLRSRRYLLESNGRGEIRAFLPLEVPADAPSGLSAWNAAASVVSLALDAERRRLGEDLALEVTVYPYHHDMKRTRFRLGLDPYRFQYTGEDRSSDAGRSAGTPLFDLSTWKRFVQEGLQLEGARLEKDGRIVLLGSRRSKRPTLLGRPIDLSDFAVAYRAIFHGGPGEPFMSLDRGVSPHTTRVNYGGRLRDTALGMVSLLCDIRFKTFSQGIDPVTGIDLRKEMQKVAPGFLTHIERFAADPNSVGISAQQTRLWFYPDTVELTVSDDGSLLAMRSVRMAAAAERLGDAASQSKRGSSPPWTEKTVRSIDESYDALADIFPELADLDQVVRLLSLFSWLKQIEGEGLPVPNLDALLDVEVPSVPTPRTFPYLLSLVVLPQPGATTGTDVLQRSEVVDALDRLLPESGRPLPARARFAALLAGGGRRPSAHTRRLQEAARIDLTSISDDEIDMAAYQLERSRMHSLVMTTLSADTKERLRERDQRERNLRVFSIGTGGLDLNMSGALRRASRSTTGLSPGRRPQRNAAQTLGVRSGEGGTVRGGRVPTRRAALASPVRRRPVSRVAVLSGSDVELPKHGLDGEQGYARSVRHATGTVPSAKSRREPAPALWFETVYDRFGRRPASRRAVVDTSGRLVEIRRLIEGRVLEYKPQRSANTVSMLPTNSPRKPPAARMLGGIEATQAVMQVASRGVGAEAARGIGLLLRVGEHSRTLTPPLGAMQRLVLGPALDATPELPLRGLEGLPGMLANSRQLFVQASADFFRPPWDRDLPPASGAEDSLHVARGLRDWWRQAQTGFVNAPDVIHAVSENAIARWKRATLLLRGKAQLLIPEGAFPKHRRALLEKIRAAWEGPEVNEVPRKVSDFVLLVSAESPDVLGRRMLDLAKDSRMRGKYLAVWSFAGEIRRDLIGRALSEGDIVALGTAGSGFVDLAADMDALAALSRELVDTATQPQRPEALGGPLIWHY